MPVESVGVLLAAGGCGARCRAVAPLDSGSKCNVLDEGMSGEYGLYCDMSDSI